MVRSSSTAAKGASPEPRKTSPFVLGLTILIIAGSAAAIYWQWKRQSGERPGPIEDAPRQAFSPEESRRIDSLRAEAIALLESARYDEAEAKFSRLAEFVPNDELVLRNVAISRLLKLANDPSPEAITSANEAIMELLDHYPTTAVHYWLLARQMDYARKRAPFEEQESALSTQLTALFRAIEIDGHDPVFRYMMREITQSSSDDEMVQRGEGSLFDAVREDPTNLFMLVEALGLMAERVRDAERFDELATRLQENLRPLRKGLLRRGNVSDPIQVLDEAKELARQGAWPKALSLVRTISWIRNDDVAQADKRRVMPHPLEYVVSKFTRADLEPPEAPPAEDFRVRFESASLDLAPGGPNRDVALGDADLNSSVDVWVLRANGDGSGSSVTILDRASRETPWQAYVTAELPIAAQRLLLADLDRDDKTIILPRPGTAKPSGDRPNIAAADLDAVIYGTGGVRVLRNEMAADGARSLVPIEQPEGLDQVVGVSAAQFGDFDHDGDLDLVVATAGTLQIWINRGNGMFENVSEWSQTPEAGGEFTSLVALDWDHDVDIDIIAMGPDEKRMGILENQRHLLFRWTAWDDPDFVSLVGARDVQALEADGNSSWDLAIACERGTFVSLSSSMAAGVLRRHSPKEVSKLSVARVLAGDLDNDGYQDLVSFSTNGVEVVRGSAGGHFAGAQPDWGAAPSGWRGAELADLDRDGDLDLVALTDDSVVVYLQAETPRHPWLAVEVRGIDEAISGRVNNLGIGCVVEVRSPDGHYQAQLVTKPTTHFGLGRHERAEVVRVLFTNGIPQSQMAVDSSQVVLEKQKPIGSCPFLYVWDGEQFVFFTDLLWGAPLGLRTAEGNLVPDRSWEYLKVDGERVAVREGHYELIFTEELWEAGYFDEIELLAVDHPADVAIYSNEKVGPPSIAEFKIHTVRDKRRLVAAKDSAGRDWLPALAAADGKFAEPFRVTYRQGLAELHHLELDFGKLDKPQRVVLFLTGWIRPTDTSINVALGQDPRVEGPRPPRVLVPDGAGGWREAIPFMGFPGGKTKTIAIDLSGVLDASDARVRIETSNELRWDEAFFTVDEAPAETRISKLELKSADLHYGGISQWSAPRDGAPDWYDYSRRDMTPQWPPMRGKFTRFGDVRELLLKTDDRMAILGAGDHILVKFAALPPPEPGWKRDFILKNVGWDKDCVLNTLLGQTVEPLPYQGMGTYPQSASDYPDTPENREYLRKYQTREQSYSEFWRQLSTPPVETNAPQR